MPTTTPSQGRLPGRARLWPLYAPGFTTVFGAHSVAAALGRFTSGHHDSLLSLGGLLALYDGAEVLLKPVFGTLADRVGARPVLLGGLAAFAAASALPAFADTTAPLWAARLGQGAAASAFSPAASPRNGARRGLDRRYPTGPCEWCPFQPWAWSSPRSAARSF
ncbi:MFS transporter [Streptomyces sp. TP-A0356]|uniref:MFS transporter n=1 Tax=Streptomyces sp. TP-A0356 TaxID=1359208 RepID=UPI0006E2991E